MSGKKNAADEQQQKMDEELHEDDTLLPLDHIAPDDPVSTAGADINLLEQIEALKQELEAQKKQAEDHRDRALRGQAELENLRKRTSRDIENAHKYALEKFINELLPVLDSLELGYVAAESATDLEPVREGMQLTLKKLSDTLEKFGVKVIDPMGEKFNPELHEAVSMVPQEGVASGQVINVMQKGFELNGRLVRPAMVVVSA